MRRVAAALILLSCARPAFAESALLEAPPIPRLPASAPAARIAPANAFRSAAAPAPAPLKPAISQLQAMEASVDSFLKENDRDGSALFPGSEVSAANIASAFDTLKPFERRVYIQRFLYGKDVPETAAALNLTVKSTRTIANKVRRRLGRAAVGEPERIKMDLSAEKIRIGEFLAAADKADETFPGSPAPAEEVSRATTALKPYLLDVYILVRLKNFSRSEAAQALSLTPKKLRSYLSEIRSALGTSDSLASDRRSHAAQIPEAVALFLKETGGRGERTFPGSRVTAEQLARATALPRGRDGEAFILADALNRGREEAAATMNVTPDVFSHYLARARKTLGVKAPAPHGDGSASDPAIIRFLAEANGQGELKFPGSRITAERLREALRVLPDREKESFLRMDVLGQSRERVASELKVKPDTVSQYMLRAREKLGIEPPRNGVDPASDPAFLRFLEETGGVGDQKFPGSDATAAELGRAKEALPRYRLNYYLMIRAFGRSRRQAAQELGISLGTLKSNLAAANRAVGMVKRLRTAAQLPEDVSRFLNENGWSGQAAFPGTNVPIEEVARAATGLTQRPFDAYAQLRLQGKSLDQASVSLGVTPQALRLAFASAGKTLGFKQSLPVATKAKAAVAAAAPTPAPAVTVPPRAKVASKTSAPRAKAAPKPQTSPRKPKAPVNDDAVLVARLKVGDPDAFTDLYALTHAKLYRFAFFKLGNKEDAEDMVQKVYLKFHRALPNFQGDSKLYTYLTRILINEMKMKWRKKNVPTESLDSPVGDEEDSTLKREIPVEDANLAATADRMMLQRALDRLDPDLKTVFLMHSVEGLEYQEIGEILGMSTTNAKTRGFRAREALKELLGEKR